MLEAHPPYAYTCMYIVHADTKTACRLQLAVLELQTLSGELCFDSDRSINLEPS